MQSHKEEPVFDEIDQIRELVDGLPSFLTIEEVASILRVSYITIYRLVQIGEICGIKVGKRWRIAKNSLLAFMEEHHPFNMD